MAKGKSLYFTDDELYTLKLACQHEGVMIATQEEKAGLDPYADPFYRHVLEIIKAANEELGRRARSFVDSENRA